jgi:hypothetical protein
MLTLEKRNLLQDTFELRNYPHMENIHMLTLEKRNLLQDTFELRNYPHMENIHVF